MKKTYNKKNDNRTSINLKSQFQKVEVGIKNGVFIFTSPLSVDEFAKKINKSSSEIIKYFFLKGKMLNINSILDEEQIGELCIEFNYDFDKKIQIDETNILQNLNIVDDQKLLKPRPPIVTIMGHVDHGKTTLLDTIRKSKITFTEAGGITQHIGAYQIEHSNKKITFIDTPGHEAFTEMRARGASVTDIVILVVAADDGIKPQTEEAIDHAKAANAPIIVFINKMDKPNVSADKVMSQLTEKNLTPEEWGGTTIYIKGSALKGEGIDKLLDSILLLSEVSEYKANPDRLANGVCIESNMDKGLGPVATVIVKNGTLAKGDFILIGESYGRVRNMYDENNNEVLLAPPSKPVKLTGLNSIPSAGENFVSLKNEKEIKEIAKKIHEFNWKKELLSNTSLDINPNDKKINIILKTDVNGSLEAIKHLLSKIEIDGASVSILRSAIGAITESDISLAKASNAFIIGFNVRPNKITKEIADNEKIKILFFDIIYKLKEHVEKMLLGVLDPIIEEVVLGEAQVKQLWKHSQVGTIAGCLVISGEIIRNGLVRVIRDGTVIYKTSISSLRHGKENINKAPTQTECGITLMNFNDLKENDIIECYKIVEKVHGE